MKLLALCMLFCPPTAAPPAPTVPLATAPFCVLYRVFDNGTPKTDFFAKGTVEIGGDDITIPKDPANYRIMTLTLEAKKDCLPGEWSILNESVYQLDWFGKILHKSATTTKPDYFTTYSPAADQSEKNGTMRVSFLVPFKGKQLEKAEFSLYISSARVNPDCDVCPPPSKRGRLLTLRGDLVTDGTSWSMPLRCHKPSSQCPCSPEDYFPTLTVRCPPFLPPFSCPCLE
jgi:hypothetical protein